jgi:5-methylcytosine-specific restriction protein A
MRREFSAATKQAAIRRSDGRCEAVGTVYGLSVGTRCENDLRNGVEFDHYPIRAADGGSNALDNCVAVCRTCHRFKTNTFDLPMVAKSKRLRRERPLPRRTFQSNRLGSFKKRLDGSVVPR